MFRFFVLGILGLFLLLLWNAGRESLECLRHFFPRIRRWIWWTGYALFIAVTLILFSSTPSFAPLRFLSLCARGTVGIFLYFLLGMNGAWLIRLFCRFLPKKRDLSLSIRLTALSLAAVLSLYGLIHPHRIQDQSYTVEVTGKSSALAEIKIVLISDLHLGYVWGADRMERIAEQINAQNPDLICIAGDVFDGNLDAVFDLEDLRSAFLSLQSRYGVYACLGNHDAGADYEEMVSFLQEAGVVLLRDEVVEIPEVIRIAGRRDSSPIGKSGEKREAMEWEKSPLPTLVLDHQPANVTEYGAEADLILFGHTHKGQIFPINFITDALFEEDYGYYRADSQSPQQIISSGVGTWGPPMRVGSDCEIVSITVSLKN